MNRMLSTSQPLEEFTNESMEVNALEVLLADARELARLAESSEQKVPVPVFPASLPGAVIGMLVDLLENGQPLVHLPGADGELPRLARSTVPIDVRRVGAEVVLAFEGGDPEKPIILGLLEPATTPTPSIASPFEVAVDQERVELTADREIVLRCGKASITLTRAGKILLRGAYLLSRSSGVNRIKGGSVQIN